MRMYRVVKGLSGREALHHGSALIGPMNVTVSH